MTREEEKIAYREKHAEEAMLDICSKHMMLGANAVVKDGYRNGFDDGVKWADETMIDKACEYLYEWNRKQVLKHGSKTNISCSEFTISVYDFRKAMKGE